MSGLIHGGRFRRLEVNKVFEKWFTDSVEEDVYSVFDVDEDSELLGEAVTASMAGLWEETVTQINYHRCFVSLCGRLRNVDASPSSSSLIGRPFLRDSAAREPRCIVGWRDHRTGSHDTGMV
jgi:hypothetical protein